MDSDPPQHDVLFVSPESLWGNGMLDGVVALHDIFSKEGGRWRDGWVTTGMADFSLLQC